MSILFDKYQKRIDQLPLIIKAIILVFALGLTFTIWYQAFWVNIKKSLAAKNNQIATLKSAIPPLETQIKSLETDTQGILKTRAKIKQDANGELPHIKVRTMLYELLKATNDLTLIELENLQPKEVNLHQSLSRTIEHDIYIKFIGNYFSTMHYLQSIEKLPWKIFWDKLEYKVTKYPMAEVTLSIHTIDNGGLKYE